MLLLFKWQRGKNLHPRKSLIMRLCKFKNLFSNPGKRCITNTAFKGAGELGYMDEDEITDVIEKLSNKNFYKSMPSDRFPELWQDVYIFKDDENDIEIYIKIQIFENKAILVQFKEYKKEEI